MNLISSIIVGGISGWLASKFMNSNLSAVGNILLGIVGGSVGGTLLGLIGLHGSGLIGNIVVSGIGACVLIAIARKIGQ